MTKNRNPEEHARYIENQLRNGLGKAIILQFTKDIEPKHYVKYNKVVGMLRNYPKDTQTTVPNCYFINFDIVVILRHENSDEEASVTLKRAKNGELLDKYNRVAKNASFYRINFKEDLEDVRIIE